MSRPSLLHRRWLASESEGVDEPVTARPPTQQSSSAEVGRTTGHSPTPAAAAAAAASRAAMATATTAVGGVRLAQEIHDEFLVCKICLDSYRNPKCLACLHTFCEQCIDNHVNSESSYKKYSDYREFTCPLCRKRTQLPVGGVKKLPDNFLVSSLTEVVGRQRPSQYPFCDICKMINHKHREASSKCLDCSKLLCSTCVQLHRDTKVTSGHSIFDVEIEKEIECKEHQDEVVRFYCEPCQACVCVMCTFNEHRDHEIMQFSEAVVKYKDNIRQMVTRCKDKIDKFDSQINSLNQCDDMMKAVEQKVHDTAIEYIQQIRNREKQIVEELQNIYGPDCMQQLANKKELLAQVESLRSTCSLTEVILTGKDIELLLLKKEVQEKLDSLSAVNVKNLPQTTNKRVEFIAGDVDLGYIHDYDRPLLSKLRPRRANTTDLDNESTITTNVETQTDPQHKHKRASSSSSSSSSSDSDSDSSDSSDSDSDAAVKKTANKVQLVDAEVQTDSQIRRRASSSSSSSSSSDEEISKTEQGTMTDQVSYEEKAVNTRSQGVTAATATNSADEDATADNSLMARRRRRRERAQTAYMTHAPQVDGIVEHQTVSPSAFINVQQPVAGVEGHQMTLAERRLLRAAYSLNSIDADDVFYDASSNHAAAQKQL